MNSLKNITLYLLIISFTSCHYVTIEKNEIGVKFKRFDSGVDTSEIMNPGRYTIPNRDYIVVYEIDNKTGNFFYFNSGEEYMVEYVVVLNKEEVALFHNYVGGDHKDYAERGLTEYLDQLPVSVIQEYVDQDAHELLENYKRAVENKYITLISLKITEMTKE